MIPIPRRGENDPVAIRRKARPGIIPKNVKAVVVKGSRKTQVADPQNLKELVDSRKEPMEKGTAGLKNLGTPVLVNMINTIGGLGVRNLQEEHSPRAPERREAQGAVLRAQ